MVWSRANSILAAATATALLLIVATIRPAATGPGGPLAPPQGEVLLTITGDITYLNSSAGARIDRAMLEDLGTATLQTSTPWTDGVPIFKGVLASRVLDLVKAEGKSVKAIAFNDYAYELPISDLRDYPVLLAFEMNGQRLEPRDKGPLWIVYPLDQFSDLRTRATERKMVWQLKELRVK